MTFSTTKFYTVFMFLYLALVLIFPCVVEAKFCGMPSTTFSGPCDNTEFCNAHCVNLEYSTYGVCFPNGGLDCFCYVNC
ncbi:unnamed protein product [Trifolium pratense]|uniref:Uncharacterized protein n=1 Tax=Trifolium pratense TaxID=57577 RepID=A0ACB0IRG5_TRIPR|nr:unnamed protein product [Trifolium pratense]